MSVTAHNLMVTTRKPHRSRAMGQLVSPTNHPATQRCPCSPLLTSNHTLPPLSSPDTHMVGGCTVTAPTLLHHCFLQILLTTKNGEGHDVRLVGAPYAVHYVYARIGAGYRPAGPHSRYRNALYHVPGMSVYAMQSGVVVNEESGVMQLCVQASLRTFAVVGPRMQREHWMEGNGREYDNVCMGYSTIRAPSQRTLSSLRRQSPYTTTCLHTCALASSALHGCVSSCLYVHRRSLAHPRNSALRWHPRSGGTRGCVHGGDVCRYHGERSAVRVDVVFKVCGTRGFCVVHTHLKEEYCRPNRNVSFARSVT
eukprot:m.115036 g.115036  ORF g.115036 m.115036 type:complete len:310 (+) comp10868_c0_seq4:1036-1965(+)